jgi:uncharacterized protein (TIGR00369 family)
VTDRKTTTETQPSSRSCFVCGRDNPLGLKARFVNDRERGEVRATVVVAEPLNGYPGTVHGGILGALLDEAAVRTALLDGGFDDLMVTGRLTVTYKRPTPTETPLTVVARLVERAGKKATAVAEVRLPDGTVTATAEALLFRPPAEVAAAWESERSHWRVEEAP